ncbi:MAG: ribonuclease domain-containing protein [Marmoricola sp.]
MSYPRDGVRFGSYEGRLPHKHPNFYREYTVQTPGISSRGARRIVAGQDGTFYYTADHYESFRRWSHDVSGRGTQWSGASGYLPSRAPRC